MVSLLQLDSSADATDSVTRRLTARFAAAWRARDGEREVVYRDLHADPLPHLEAADLHWPTPMRSGPVPDTAQALLQEVVDELLAADVIVIGVPLYNYSMPSTLKAWLDRIHLPGVTAVPSSPLAGRPVVLVTASGIAYDEGSPTAGWDHAIPPLQLILGTTLGMDVHVVAARLTLAEKVPDLASEIERSRAELASAEQELEGLAARL